MDNWDHLVAEDLQQAATIIASFVWNTSQRDERLPRKPNEEEVREQKRVQRVQSEDYKILDLSGKWDYSIDIAGTTYGGEMTLTKNGGESYDVRIVTDDAPDEPEVIKGVENKANRS